MNLRTSHSPGVPPAGASRPPSTNPGASLPRPSRGDPAAPLTPAASLRLGDRRKRSLAGCGLFRRTAASRMDLQLPPPPPPHRDPAKFEWIANFSSVGFLRSSSYYEVRATFFFLLFFSELLGGCATLRSRRCEAFMHCSLCRTTRIAVRDGLFTSVSPCNMFILSTGATQLKVREGKKKKQVWHSVEVASAPRLSILAHPSDPPLPPTTRSASPPANIQENRFSRVCAFTK